MLSLNDTIGELLPKQPKAWPEITRRQLLNHSSGLPDYAQNPRFGIGKAPPEKLLSYIKDKDLLFDPGSRYKYSNSNNIVVALMVKSATNRTYNGQLQEQVYGPLSLMKTTLPRGANLNEPYVHGYDNDPNDHPPRTMRADRRRLALGFRRRSIHARRPQRLHPRLRGRRPLRLADPRPKRRLLMAASPDGTRSVVVSVNEQLTPKEGAPGVFPALCATERRAVCAALSAD